MQCDLKQNMERRGYTVCALAEELGVHSKVISRWRAGGLPVKDEHIRALLRIFGRSLHLGNGCRPPVNHAFERWLEAAGYTGVGVAACLGITAVELYHGRSGRILWSQDTRKKLEVLSGGAVPYGSWQ